MAWKQIPLLVVLLSRFPESGKDNLHAKILCGEVLVDGECIRDPRHPVPVDAEIQLVEKSYVSRGALKLLHALECWNVDVHGKVFIDAGASTGGFSEVLLKRGAAMVHAVDVGYNQLDYTLRRDRRIVVHERANIMEMESFVPLPDAAVADLSFRSVVKAAAHILPLTREGWMIALVKPQFELRTHDRRFTGVVEEKAVLERILLEVIDRFESENLTVERTIPSPVKGRKGNIEFLFLVRSSGSAPSALESQRIRESIIIQVMDTDLV